MKSENVIKRLGDEKSNCQVGLIDLPAPREIRISWSTIFVIIYIMFSHLLYVEFDLPQTLPILRYQTHSHE